LGQRLSELLEEILSHLGVSINGATPIAGWFISWKIPTRTRGSPVSGNHHLWDPNWCLSHSQSGFNTTEGRVLPQNQIREWDSDFTFMFASTKATTRIVEDLQSHTEIAAFQLTGTTSSSKFVDSKHDLALCRQTIR